MGKVNLDDIKPGMKLEKDVQERSGRVLLRAGTEITERHLNIFRTWGVAEADIESMGRQEATAQATRNCDPEVLKAAQEFISPLFVHTDATHAPVRELKARLQVGFRLLSLQRALAARVFDLEEALAQVKLLQGLLPICSYCKNIRDDNHYWQQIESYVSAHSETQFSHSICPTCYEKVVKAELESFQQLLKDRLNPACTRG